MAKTSLPPGFRFHPTDVELVRYYLKRKVMGKRLGFSIISEVDIYKFAPWDLPDQSCLKNRDLKWYFFCPRKRKYATGARAKRVTEFGFWKATGNDRAVLYNKETAGMIKTLIFHRGKAPRGERTNWVMHEYRLEDKDLANKGIVQDAYVLCLIFQKDGPGPRNGAQYGAPFKEEDWSDDDEEVDCVQVTPYVSLPEAATVLPINQNTSAATTSCMGSMCTGPIYEAGPSETFLPNEKKHPSNDIMSMLDAFHVPEDDDAISMLPAFTEDNTSVPVVNDKNEEQNLQQPNNLNCGKNVEAAACMDRNDIYNKLGDLGTSTELSENMYDFYDGYKAVSVQDQMLSGESYLELTDLNSPLNGLAEPTRFGHDPTDSLLAYHSGYNSEQYYPMDSFGSAPHVSGFGESSMLPGGPYKLESQYNSFQKEDGLNQNASQGYMGFDAGL